MNKYPVYIQDLAQFKLSGPASMLLALTFLANFCPERASKLKQHNLAS